MLLQRLILWLYNIQWSTLCTFSYQAQSNILIYSHISFSYLLREISSVILDLHLSDFEFKLHYEVTINSWSLPSNVTWFVKLSMLTKNPGYSWDATVWLAHHSLIFLSSSAFLLSRECTFCIKDAKRLFKSCMMAFSLAEMWKFRPPGGSDRREDS